MELDVRWKQRFANFSKAVTQLQEFIDKPDLNKLERQGIIQCFEYTFELGWKTMKDYLEAEGFTIKSPRDCIQTAFQARLAPDGHAWIDALEKRNLLSHTYDENRANEAETLIRSKYYKIIVDLQKTLAAKL